MCFNIIECETWMQYYLTMEKPNKIKKSIRCWLLFHLILPRNSTFRSIFISFISWSYQELASLGKLDQTCRGHEFTWIWLKSFRDITRISISLGPCNVWIAIYCRCKHFHLNKLVLSLAAPGCMAVRSDWGMEKSVGKVICTRSRSC